MAAVPFRPQFLLLLLFLLSPDVRALKIYKSRAEVLALIGEQEGRLYFSNCEMSSRRASCVYAMDESYSQEPTQCAITDPDQQPWWMAILDTPSYVTKVTLLNMDQSFRSHPDALRSISIMANDDVCFRYESTEIFVKRSFPCDTVADQILIKSTLDTAVLALCDVEVFGAPIKFPGVLDDPAVLKVRSCLQSSVKGNGYCKNAFDGDANSNHNEKPCAVTADSTGFDQSGEREMPWIEANLLKPALVTEVRLYNRADCCSEGLNSIRITLNNRQCAEHEGNFASMAFFCKFFGDVVRVSSQKVASMSVCEMQVLGYTAALDEPEKFKPLGCYKDDYTNRDLTQLVSSITMSHDKCYKMCKRLGQKYFAVQNGRHCWCGAAFGKHGADDDSKCAIPCEDDDKQVCGGPISNNVFEII